MTLTDQECNEKYSEKVITSGAWIDSDFLEDVLGDSVKVDSYNVCAAVGAGDNYLSILYKTVVNYHTHESSEQKTSHLMVKGHPTAQILLDMIEDMGVFRKEISIYNNCLPAMHKVLKEYFPAGTEFVAAGAYPTSRPDTVVMDDLGEQGYRMANRREQLDFEHCATTLRALARFHALSAKVYEDDPDLILSVATELYQDSIKEKMAPFLEMCIPVLAKEIEGWEGRAQYAPLLREINENLWNKMIAMVKRTENFNVLNHGDMWVNNIMYKYNEDGHVTSAKLVDFQLSRYTSPALDLLYFLFTSPRAEVLSNEMFNLISLYHEALLADLATLGVNVHFPLSQLHEDMRDRATFAIMTMAQILPIIVVPPKDVLDLDNMTMEDAKKPLDESPMLNSYRNDYYVQVAGKFLEHLDAIGYLRDAKERTPLLLEKVEAKQSTEQLVGSCVEE